MEHVNLGRGWDDQRHARLVPVVLCCFATEHYELLGLLAVYRLGHVERVDNDQQLNATKRSTSISKIIKSKLNWRLKLTTTALLKLTAFCQRVNQLVEQIFIVALLDRLEYFADTLGFISSKQKTFMPIWKVKMISKHLITHLHIQIVAMQLEGRLNERTKECL